MLSQMVKPTFRTMCWLRTLPDRRRALLGIGGILGIASVVGAIGTLRALPILRRKRSNEQDGKSWLRGKLGRQGKQ
jgi:hypothetical protein